MPIAWQDARERLAWGRATGGGLRQRRAVPPRRDLGAVLLLPFQVSGLGTPSPAVTPAKPALQRGRRSRRSLRLLAAGTDRRSARPGAHRRNLARRHRRLGHPGRTATRT